MEKKIVNQDEQKELENKEQTNDAPKKKESLLKTILGYVINIIICIVAAFIINSFLLINANIPSSSMENTIPINSRVFGNRLAYSISSPKRNDIIIFWAPDDKEVLYVKRVIGLPGDKVQIINGALFVNDEFIEEDFIKETMIGSYGPYIVPEDSYFVMGDNRNASSDSRFWQTTNFVTKDDIVAEAMFMYYPKFKILK